MKSSPSHLCGQTEVVLCALQFHSLETSCFPHWGLAVVSHLLTSTSFGWSWWPVAGLQLHIWPPLPLQSADVGPMPCLCTIDRLHWLQGRKCSLTSTIVWHRCKLGRYNCSNISESLDYLYHSFNCWTWFSFPDKPWNGTLLPCPSSVFSHSPLEQRKFELILDFLAACLSSIFSKPVQPRLLPENSKKNRWSPLSGVGWMPPWYGTVTHARLLAIGAPPREWVGVS